MEEGSARLGVRPQSGPVELDRNAGSSIVPPDQTYFNDLNGELTDKGFLATSTEDLFQWARTGSLRWMTFGPACCPAEMNRGIRSASCKERVWRSVQYLVGAATCKKKTTSIPK